MINYLLLGAVALFFATGCTHSNSQAEPEKTQLEIREFQTRNFEVGNHHLVMKSIINVLQDDGYMIKNSSEQLGLLAATKEVALGQNHWAAADDDAEIEPTIILAGRGGFGVGFGLKNRFPMTKERSIPTHELIEATVNVSQFGDKVRVRSTFQTKVYDNHERIVRVQHITNEQFYQDFFAKVDKGIFIQQQNI